MCANCTVNIFEKKKFIKTNKENSKKKKRNQQSYFCQTDMGIWGENVTVFGGGLKID